MSKKKDEARVFATPEEEIAYLKKQNAGLKGYITNITKKLDETEDRCRRMGERIRKAEGVIEEIGEKVRAYNRLPWYKRMFRRCI